MARVRILCGDKSKDSSSARAQPDFYSLHYCHEDNEDLLSSEAPVVSTNDPARVTQDTSSSENSLLATSTVLPDRVNGIKRSSSSCVDFPSKFPKHADSVALYQGMNLYTNTELFTIDDFNEVMKI